MGDDPPHRLFVAFPLDDQAKDYVRTAQDRLRSRLVQGVAAGGQSQSFVRWTSDESWHLTLQFIGDAPPSAVDLLRERLSALSRNPDLFSRTVYGKLGSAAHCFPPLRQLQRNRRNAFPRVLHLPVCDRRNSDFDSETEPRSVADWAQAVRLCVQQWQADFDAEIADADDPPRAPWQWHRNKSDRFTPHITLGRVATFASHADRQRIVSTIEEEARAGRSAEISWMPLTLTRFVLYRSHLGNSDPYEEVQSYSLE